MAGSVTSTPRARFRMRMRMSRQKAKEVKASVGAADGGRDLAVSWDKKLDPGPGGHPNLDESPPFRT